MQAPTAASRLAQINQAFKGYTTFHVLTLGAELNLFPHLGRAPDGLTATELATQLGLHEPYVKIWCETAFSVDFLDFDAASQRFKLGEALHELLGEPQHPTYQGDFFQIFGSYFSREMLDLPGLFRSGELSSSSERRKDFAAMLKARGTVRGILFTSTIIPRIAGLQENFQSGLALLDVGCGAGTFMLHLAREYPRSSFYGVDIDDHAVEIASQEVRDSGLKERVRVEQISKNGVGFEETFDVATLNLVLHEIDITVRGEAMGRVYRALKGPGILAILDFPYPSSMEEFRQPSFAMGVIDQFYEAAWGSRHQTWEEIQAMLEPIGFCNFRREFLSNTPYAMMIAEKR